MSIFWATANIVEIRKNPNIYIFLKLYDFELT